MPYSKEFWLKVGAIVLAVIVVVAVIRLRSEDVQRTPLFSTPGETKEAADEFDMVQLPELDVVVEAQGPKQAPFATPSPEPPVPTPTPTLTLMEKELLETTEREELERKAREQIRLQEERREMARRYVALATEQTEQLKNTFDRLRQLSEGKVNREERRAFLTEYLRELKSFAEKRDSIRGFGSKDDAEQVDSLIESIKSRLDVLAIQVERGDIQIPGDVAEKVEAELDLLGKALARLDLESE